MGALRIAVTGATGRMGQTLIRDVQAADDLELAGASEAPGHASLGTDIGEIVGCGPTGVKLTDAVEEAFANAEAVIDFTIPSATRAYVEETARAGLIHVIGTTGLDADTEAAIAKAAERATIIKSGNMSLGVNLLAHLTQQTAKLLDANFDIEIVEMHHRHKIDAPSGTALLLGEAAAKGRNVRLSDVAARGRDGQTGARRHGDIGFASLRGGEVVGDHTVMFASGNERIELTHKAQDRGLFSSGALHAARWGAGKAPGLYSMADVLGFTD